MTMTTATPDPTPEDSSVQTIDQTLDATDIEVVAVVSDQPVQLDPDDLACRECGRVVAGPIDVSRISWDDPSSIERPGGLGTSTSVGGIAAEPLTTCAECEARRELARDLATRLLPTGVAMSGVRYSGEHVVELVASSLSVLAALGARVPGPRQNRDVLALLVRRLAPLGTSLGWGARFAPHRAADARPGTANPRPWAHVAGEGRDVLRRAHIHFVADKMSLDAPAVRLSPPPFASPSSSGRSLSVPSACIFCGIGVVELPAATVARLGGRAEAAQRVWQLRTSVSPHSLGGRRSPNGIAGYSCPPCSEAVQHVGALGVGAMERSVLVALDLVGRWNENADALEGLIGFGALYSNAVTLGKPLPSPGSTPWAHMGDLDQLRDKLDAALSSG